MKEGDKRRQAEVDKMMNIVTEEGYVLPEVIAEILVDHNIGTAKRFRGYRLHTELNHVPQTKIIIEPIKYKEEDNGEKK